VAPKTRSFEYARMKKATSLEAIRGIPKLQIIEGSICGECQVGKL